MLKIENISKTFSLNANDGDFITIVGSNGAGKSTLFNSIAGNFFVDEGKIILDDLDITYMPNHKRSKYIGRLFQDPMSGTAPHMTIKENLALAYMRATTKTHIFSCISKKEEEGFKQALKELDMGLEDRLDTPVGTLSGGQRQALTLIMATIQKPKILLLDEHTAALDPKTAKKVLDVTDKIVKKHNLTTFMVTHNMKDAIEHGNRLIMMDGGKIIFDIKGDEKKELTVEKLLEKFNVVNDAMLLK